MQGNLAMDPQNVFELAIPTFKFIRNEGLSKTILRWEDDGGQIIEFDHSTVDQKEKNNNEKKSWLVDRP
jgi:hypothetical protein